ncbi:MAG: hypothetical protein A3A51_01950 [Candidatus Levybacteria bacterium RIFCSPLOWO2_01_FULL_39_10]|nr:MAG: hypothetical protein A3A51_01950 [Candidatus Levybacteria bacterium RIFCSPLOWO2_01_FULL_39_10]
MARNPETPQLPDNDPSVIAMIDEGLYEVPNLAIRLGPMPRTEDMRFITHEEHDVYKRFSEVSLVGETPEDTGTDEKLRREK